MNSTSINWRLLFNTTQEKAKIPVITKENYSNLKTIIREMYIDLGDIKNQITQKELNPPLIYIFADVVKIPDNFTWNLNNNGLIIVSRRIEVGESSSISLDLGECKSTKLIIYAEEISSSLKITGMLPNEESKDIYLQDIESLGKVFLGRNNELAEMDINNLDMAISSNSVDLQIIFSAIFQYATILFYEQPEIAFSQLKWIKDCTKLLSTFDSMFCQASSLLVLLKTTMSDVTFVPYLSRQIYTQSIKTFVDVARSYENEYTNFCNLNCSIDDRKKSANLMLQHYQDTVEFSNSLIEQTKENYKSAEAAVQSILADFTSQKNQVELTKIKFEFELDKWKRKKELEATVKILTGVFEFVGAIGAMCVGDEAAAPAAEKATQTVAESAIDFSKLMKKLSTLIEVLKDVYNLSNQISTATGNLSDIDDLKNTIKKETIDKLDAQDLTSTVEWDNFKLEVDNYLDMAIKADIPQTNNYKLQLEKMIVYGKALAQNRVALIKVSQQLVKLRLKKEVEKNQTTRISNFIKQMSEEKEENVELMQVVYEQYLNVKRDLFISIINYRWAYKYWALKESLVKPVMSDNISELNDALSNIQNDYNNALQSFNPPPQEFSNLVLTINDADLLTVFKKNKKLILPITLSNEIFKGFERVRVRTIRVWINGIKTDINKVSVKITNSGNYNDTYDEKPFSFTSNILQRLFEYEIDTNKIIVDGTIAEEEKFAYFVPTPFSTWKIEVAESFNQGLDLSEVESIKIEFTGDMIADMNL
ncbi:MAG: hypothetical protein KAX49_03050 [Halanaerobiales bacterium]|nr:hypothetical protein [Halanaerobiales bacterium]